MWSHTTARSLNWSRCRRGTGLTERVLGDRGLSENWSTGKIDRSCPSMGRSGPRRPTRPDGGGVIDALGDGVDPQRMGRRVWVYGAQSYRPFGTAAEYTVVPEAQAVDLPDEVPDEMGACLGIPGVTAHRAVFGDGVVTGQT